MNLTDKSRKKINDFLLSQAWESVFYQQRELTKEYKKLYLTVMQNGYIYKQEMPNVREIKERLR